MKSTWDGGGRSWSIKRSVEGEQIFRSRPRTVTGDGIKRRTWIPGGSGREKARRDGKQRGEWAEEGDEGVVELGCCWLTADNARQGKGDPSPARKSVGPRPNTPWHVWISGPAILFFQSQQSCSGIALCSPSPVMSLASSEIHLRRPFAVALPDGFTR